MGLIPTYELARLDPNTFEHLVNALAIRELGTGVTTFAPGSDGGRDGYFEGMAPYPSSVEQWDGIWYIQSKFHSPHLTTDSQKWLVEQISQEIHAFNDHSKKRKTPDNWIVATNIEPTAVPESGSFDRANELVRKSLKKVGNRFHIWGGRKILDLLIAHKDIADYYGSYVTPGMVIARLYDELHAERASVEQIIRNLVATQLTDQQFTKLEQAGSSADVRPGIQKLFTDLPFRSGPSHSNRLAAYSLSKSMAQVHRAAVTMVSDRDWSSWLAAPERARAWFIKGGPGQGKSTLTQYMAQIHRAAVVSQTPNLLITQTQRLLVDEIQLVATKQDLWPLVPRIPVTVELKNFAGWYGQRSEQTGRRLISFLSDRLSADLALTVHVNTLQRMFGKSHWFFVFDGLDEVPVDVKDGLAKEILHFIDDVLIASNSDAMIVCTSRPQGYSGQFATLEAAEVVLAPLSAKQALACAAPVLRLERSTLESRELLSILEQSLISPSIAEIMTTPLQSHIMAVIVRDGGKPPERRWQLYNTFYEVIKKREANKNMSDKALSRLLREGDRLLRALHDRLGFELHSRAETSSGASTSIDRVAFKGIVTEVVKKLHSQGIQSTVNLLMRATTDRLVLVNTPESGENIRFDIRPLQEFFAGEFIYKNGDPSHLEEKLRIIAADAHWREVMHFLLSALVERERSADLAVAVSILVEMDGGVTANQRLFHRRVALGARMAFRLLAEGVLEQDRQIRDRFRNVIQLLSAQTNIYTMMVEKLQTHSLSWLLDVLITAVKEQAPSESIGAMVGLCLRLNDRDKRVSDVYKIIQRSDIKIRSAVIVQISSDRSPRSKLKHFKWVVQLCYELLEEHEWTHIEPQAIFCAIAIIGQNDVALRSILHQRSCSSALISMLSDVFVNYDNVSPDNKNLKKVEYGILEKHLLPCPASLNLSTWGQELWIECETMKGLFRSLYLVLKSSFTEDPHSIICLRESLGGDIANVKMLPDVIRSFLKPVIDIDDCKLSDLPVRVLEKDTPGMAQFIVRYLNPAGTGEIDWRRFVQDDPMFWIPVFSERGGEWKSLVEYCKDENRRAALLKTFINIGIIFNEVANWGALFSDNNPLGVELRQNATISAAKQPLRQESRRLESAFALKLPEEASLLPHVLAAILDDVSPIRKRYYGAERKLPKNAMSKFIKEYVPAVQMLKTISESNIDKRVKVAAHIMYVIHPDHSNGDRQKNFIDNFESESAQWMLPGIGLALFDKIVRGDASSIETFGTLLDITLGDVKARAAVDGVFDAWRETSRGRLTSVNTDLWVNQ